MTQNNSTDQFFASLNHFSNMLMQKCKQLEEGIAANGAAINGSKPNGKAKHIDETLAKASLNKIAPFMENPNVTDILINKYDEIYVDTSEGIARTEVKLMSEQELLNLCSYLAKECGRTLNMDCPVLDARMADGTRINVIAPPLSPDGTCVSLRKFAKESVRMADMVHNGCLSEQMAEIIAMSVAARMNIFISGGTGSGKTTMLNAISEYVSEKERVVTIEDSLELQLGGQHVVRLEAKLADPTVSNSSDFTIRQLVKNALRMRPDRIIIGETRGAEALDMIHAMNTGHDGSMTTLHANKPRDVISRLENMINMGSSNTPQKAIREQIASAANLIIQLRRFEDGVRRIEYITEVTGMEGETIAMQDLFKYERGDFQWSGILPRFLPKLVEKGFQERVNQTFHINI